MGSCVQRKWVAGGGGLYGYFRDSQLASRSVSNDITGDALAISAGILFQNGTGRMKKSWIKETLHGVRGCDLG